MGMLLGLILFPIAAVLFLIFAALAFHMIHESPVLWWTLVGFVVVFTPIFISASWHEWRRKRRQAAKKAAGA